MPQGRIALPASPPCTHDIPPGLHGIADQTTHSRMASCSYPPSSLARMAWPASLPWLPYRHMVSSSCPLGCLAWSTSDPWWHGPLVTHGEMQSQAFPQDGMAHQWHRLPAPQGRMLCSSRPTCSCGITNQAHTGALHHLPDAQGHVASPTSPRMLALHHIPIPVIALHHIPTPMVALHHIHTPMVALHHIPTPMVALHHNSTRMVALHHIPTRMLALHHISTPMVTLHHIFTRMVSLHHIPTRMVALHHSFTPMIALHHIFTPMVV